MKLLYKLLRQEPDTREGVITVTSVLGLAVNVLISVLKIILGTLTNSIAILSEGLHSAADAATSVLTVLGVKLAAKRPTAKHPFGFGRIEYLTGLVIAVLILYTGLEILVTSVGLIFAPEPLHIEYLTLAIIAVTAVVKLLLGAYTVRKGRSVASDTLVGLGEECRNDALASVITLASAAVFVVFGVSLDAYAGIVTGVLILRTAVKILLPTLSDILGRAGDRELADTLYRKIRATEGVANAADMMLHNYGPDAWSASVNLEIDQGKTVGEVYQFLHKLQLDILREHRVTMVFGIYAVNEKDGDARKLRAAIARFVRDREHVKSYHALYYSREENRIYCDFVVEYGNFSWDTIREDFAAYMAPLYPATEISLVIETEYV